MASLFDAGIKTLENFLHPTLSDSYYKARFCIQVIFCSILLIACLVYLILTYLDSRRTSRPIALLRIQRVASGRFIVVNALVFLVLFNALAAVLLLVMRYKVYTIYYGNGTLYNRVILGTLSWLPLSLVAWAYSFGNIAAMMQIKTRDYGGPSRRAVIAYNVAFCAILLAAFGVALPCCILANARMNKVLDLAQTLLDLLYASTTPGTTISLNTVQTINDLQSLIALNRNRIATWIRVVLAIVAGISCLTAISAIAAFWFIAFLFELPNEELVKVSMSPRSPTPFIPIHEQAEENHEITTFLGLGVAPETRPLTAATRMEGGPVIGNGRSQNIALTRLYKDLMLSVPIVLILSVYCLVVAILTGCHLNEPKWREIQQDGLSWTSPVLLIIVVAFLHNLIKYRNTSPSITSQSATIQLSRSPSNSPRNALVGSFNLSNVKQSEEEEEEGYKIRKVEDCIDPFEERSNKKNVEIVKESKGDVGCKWLDMPEFDVKTKKQKK